MKIVIRAFLLLLAPLFFIVNPVVSLAEESCWYKALPAADPGLCIPKLHKIAHKYDWHRIDKGGTIRSADENGHKSGSGKFYFTDYSGNDGAKWRVLIYATSPHS